VEFTRFFNYYKNAPDLSSKNSGGVASSDTNSTRYFINVGAKDDFDWMSLKDFLKETLDLGRDDVYKVDVKDSFSFFNTDAAHTNKVLETFSEFKRDGRHVNVEVTTDSGKGNRGGGKRNFSDKKKRSFKSNSEGGSRRRSGGDSNSKGRSRGKKAGSRNKNIESSIKRRRSKN
jgi:ATP-dependent RNA helicase DeaD